LLKTTTDRSFRLQVLEEAMANFHRYLFVMPTLAAFELECYTKLESGKALTADVMSETLLALLREGYGDAVTIDAARMGISWATFTHLFTPYYVYNYATGISAANALCEQVLSEGRPAAERYLSFLKAGDSLYPLDAIRLAGVDMLSPEPIEAAFRVVTRVVEEIEALVATS
jgi:oligoendopeptidase F